MVAWGGQVVVRPASALSDTGIHVRERPPYIARSSANCCPQADDNPAAVVDHPEHVNGRMIGIPTLTAVDPVLGDARAPGIGFAIPSDTVRQVADSLIASG
jgi:hypothetical protein